jgi:serine/threonine protein kinase
VIYCINPWCKNRYNEDHALTCSACNTELFLDGRIRVIQPVGEFRKFHPFDVYEAIDCLGNPIRAVNSNVILKVLKDDEKKYINLFLEEFDALKTLRFPGIPESDIDDYFSVAVGGDKDDLLYCLVLSKFEGLTLTEWIKEHGKLNQDTLIDWMGQLSEIVDYIHSQGYIHRDIKPDNIIVRKNHKLSLIDYGGAKKLTSSYLAKLANPVNQNDTQIYSLLYSAPEQLDGRATPQSDFFSFGRTFIYAATGEELNVLPRNARTGELDWFRDASQLDQPTKRFIQTLVNPLPRKRPLTSGELVSTIFYNLPESLKWIKIARSKGFKFSLAILFCLVCSIFFQVGRLAISESYYNSGVSQFNSNQVRLAKISFRNSIQIHKTEKAYLSLAEACKLDKDYDCAIDSYKKVTEFNKKNSTAYFNLGILYEDHMYKAGKIQVIDENIYSLSVDAYKNAASINTENPIYINNLARLYILKGDYSSAERLIKSILGKTNKEKSLYALALLYKNLGWAKYQQGETVQAENLLTQAAAYNQPLASPHCLLALINDTNTDREGCFDLDAEDVANPEVKKWQKFFYTKSTKK